MHGFAGILLLSVEGPVHGADKQLQGLQRWRGVSLHGCCWLSRAWSLQGAEAFSWLCDGKPGQKEFQTAPFPSLA